MKRFIALFFGVAALAVPMTVRAYAYAGYRWGGTSPAVTVNTSGLGLTAWRTSAQTAMSDWNATGARFTFNDSSGSNNTTSYYYQQSSVLAYTQITHQFLGFGNVTKATIAVNNYHNFNPPYRTGSWYDLRTVLAHELGHWLVLNHPSSPSSLMYAYIDANTVKPVSQDDVNGIRVIYGTR